MDGHTLLTKEHKGDALAINTFHNGMCFNSYTLITTLSFIKLCFKFGPFHITRTHKSVLVKSFCHIQS